MESKNTKLTHVTALKFLEDIVKKEVKFSMCDVNLKSPVLRLAKPLILGVKNTSSMAETLFGELLLDSVQGKAVLQVVMKIFVDSIGDEDFQPEIEGLKYEALLYQTILKKIIAENYSPNFVSYVGYATCNINQFQDKMYLENLKDLQHRLRKIKTVNVLITEKVGNGAYFDLSGIYPVKTLEYVYSELYENKDDEAAESILFQLVYSLEVLQRFRIIHNDLHAGNVLVTIFPKRVKLGFIVGEKAFFIRTHYVPYIFDWDHSYAEVLGPNPKLEHKYYRDMNIYNRYSKKEDLYRLFCNIGFKGSIPATYNTDITYRKENNIVMPISPEQYEAVSQYDLYIEPNVYKMSGTQLRDLLFTTEKKLIDFEAKERGKQWQEKVTEKVKSTIEATIPENATNIMFTLEKNHYYIIITDQKGVDAFHTLPTNTAQYNALLSLYHEVPDLTKIDVIEAYRDELYNILINNLPADQKADKNIVNRYAIIFPNSPEKIYIKIIKPEYVLFLYNPIRCRMTAIDKSFPTPMELLTTKFQQFEIEKDKLESTLHEDFIYRLPVGDITASLFIDPHLQRKGRKKATKLLRGSPAKPELRPIV